MKTENGDNESHEHQMWLNSVKSRVQDTLPDNALSENAASQSMVPTIPSKQENEEAAARDKMTLSLLPQPQPPPPPSQIAPRNKPELPVIEIGHLLARTNRLQSRTRTAAMQKEESRITTASPVSCGTSPSL